MSGVDELMRVIGQARVKRILSIAVKSKKDVLLLGNPGLGKSTVAKLYASQFDDEILSAQGSEVEEYLDVIRAHQGPVIVDEAHDARGTALINVIDDANRTALPVILTSTEDAIFEPLKTRCLVIVMESYSDSELGEIISGVAPRMSEATRLALARLSRGSPRRAKLFGEILASMIASSDNCQPDVDLSDTEVNRLMNLVGYPCGLNLREVNLMENLVGGPRSRFSLAGSLGCKPTSLWAVESFTITSGLTSVTSRGRMLTESGRKTLALIDKVK